MAASPPSDNPKSSASGTSRGSAAAPDVGQDIESICSQCGDMWHVVVAKKSETSLKVQCKVCSRTHVHKLGKPAAAKRSTRKAAAGGTRALPAGPTITVDESRPVRGYKISETFVKGDRVDHSTFGLGVVEEVLGPEKIQVYFPGGRKVLAQAKGAQARA